MKYLLDSNILIAIGEATSEKLLARLRQADEDDLVTSSIAFGEVLHGSTRGKPPPVEALERIMEDIAILPFDSAAARAYASLPFERGSYDRLIAAHALALGFTMVTNDLRHFSAVPGLTVENWTI